jgi:hypothetical protein
MRLMTLAQMRVLLLFEFSSLESIDERPSEER